MRFIESIFDVSHDGGTGLLESWVVYLICVAFSVRVWWKSAGNTHFA